jgi:hypothetical protein
LPTTLEGYIPLSQIGLFKTVMTIGPADITQIYLNSWVSKVRLEHAHDFCRRRTDSSPFSHSELSFRLQPPTKSRTVDTAESSGYCMICTWGECNFKDILEIGRQCIDQDAETSKRTFYCQVQYRMYDTCHICTERSSRDISRIKTPKY